MGWLFGGKKKAKKKGDEKPTTKKMNGYWVTVIGPNGSTPLPQPFHTKRAAERHMKGLDPDRFKYRITRATKTRATKVHFHS